MNNTKNKYRYIIPDWNLYQLPLDTLEAYWKQIIKTHESRSVEITKELKSSLRRSKTYDPNNR